MGEIALKNEGCVGSHGELNVPKKKVRKQKANGVVVFRWNECP